MGWDEELKVPSKISLQKKFEKTNSFIFLELILLLFGKKNNYNTKLQ